MLPVVWVPARCGANSARPSGRTGIGARTFGAPQQRCCRTCSERQHSDEKKVYHIVILLQHTLPMVPAHMWLTCLWSMFKPNVAHGIFCFHALIRLIQCNPSTLCNSLSALSAVYKSNFQPAQFHSCYILLQCQRFWFNATPDLCAILLRLLSTKQNFISPSSYPDSRAFRSYSRIGGLLLVFIYWFVAFVCLFRS